MDNEMGAEERSGFATTLVANTTKGASTMTKSVTIIEEKGMESTTVLE